MGNSARKTSKTGEEKGDFLEEGISKLNPSERICQRLRVGGMVFLDTRNSRRKGLALYMENGGGGCVSCWQACVPVVWS